MLGKHEYVVRANCRFVTVKLGGIYTDHWALTW